MRTFKDLLCEILDQSDVIATQLMGIARKNLDPKNQKVDPMRSVKSLNINVLRARVLQDLISKTEQKPAAQACWNDVVIKADKINSSSYGYDSLAKEALGLPDCDKTVADLMREIRKNYENSTCSKDIIKRRKPLYAEGISADEIENLIAEFEKFEKSSR